MADVRPDDLLAGLLRHLVESTGAHSVEVNGVVAGCATPQGEQGWNLARQSALIARLPDTVPGVTVNRMCGSSE